MNPESRSEMGSELLPTFWVTIKLTTVPVIGSLIFGTFLITICVSPVGILCTLSTQYTNIVRSTPLTLIVLLASMGLYHNLGLLPAAENDSFTVKQNLRLTVLASVAYTSCFVAESLHAGISTVPFDQAEVARPLGLSFDQSFRYIIFPQAFCGTIAPLGNTLIALIKNITIVSIVGVVEAPLLMKTTTENYTSDILIILGIIAIGFIILTLPTGLFFGWTGK